MAVFGPGPRTTYGPRNTPMDPPLQTIPQNRVKIRNKYFSCGLSNRSCRRNFERYIIFCKCNILGLRLGPKLYHYTLPFPLLWPYSIWKTGKPLGSLEICALSPLPFFSAHSRADSWTRSRLLNLLSGITDTNKLKQRHNIPPIVRLSHEWKVKTLLLTIGISLRWKQLLGIFFWEEGWGVKTQVCYICTV